ncbi:MAG: PAS domain S-box protein [Leptospiraceae bacterium]|nr:PAS domain S-box protein [Leptospiraceae bacterium]
MDIKLIQELLKKAGAEAEVSTSLTQSRFMIVFEMFAGFLLYLIAKENPDSFLHLIKLPFFDSRLGSNNAELVFHWGVLNGFLLSFRFIVFYLLPRELKWVQKLQSVTTFIAGIFCGLSFLVASSELDEKFLVLFSLIILVIIASWCVTTVNFLSTLYFIGPAFLLVEIGLILNLWTLQKYFYPEVYAVFFFFILYTSFRIGKNYDLLYRLAIAVTKEKQETELAQKALSESESEYRHLVQNSNGIILRFDRQGKIRFMNDYGLSFFGYKNEEVIGKSILETILLENDTYSKDLKSMMNQLFQNPSSFLDNENENILRDGRRVYIRWRNSLLNEFGDNTEILSVGIDITETIIARNELKQKENYLRSILEKIPIPIAITKVSDGTYAYVNEKSLQTFKVPKEKVKDVNVSMFVVNTDVRKKYLDRLFNNPDTVVSGEILLKDFENKEFWVIISYALIEINGEKAILAGIQDISEQKRVEEVLASARKQAEESNRLKDRFMSLISHDLSGPIGGIKSMANMLISPDFAPNFTEENKIHYIELIGKTSSNLLEMLGQLLNVTRLKTGKIVPFKKIVKLRRLVENMTAPFSSKLKELSIEFENQIKQDDFLFADSHLIGEVISNLFTNAMKFTPAGGKIIIQIKNDSNDFSILTVTDTGNGIPDSILLNLFRHEVKTSMPGLHGEKGTGLGLPYSKDIIEAHGGKILVRTEKDKGSSFDLYIPTMRPIFLIVDDLDVHRIIVRDAIQSGGFDVDILEANNGLEALEILEHVVPDLIVTDIFMPEMDGWKLIEEIQKKEGFAKIPIIIMTSKLTIDSSPEFENKSKMVQEIISKPLDPNNFITLLSKYGRAKGIRK